ncbi:phage tail tube protein [Actinacidiphila acidipaludis]|uniref:Phage tail protein n=1 Tax=Actinacidiphila acidipaludis TaxID=2873382 RepID=A0ABS7Q4N6_9ACTN|nr:phage tail protein [Streptomyces acidipaludis]MBY8878067.1 phage tail protein [Streptomyces acidipaludis]
MAVAGNNSSEIRVAGTGRILVAAVGALAPTDTGTPWDAAWTDLGYTSADGVTFSKKDKLDPVDTWQAVSPVRFIYSDRELTLKFSLMQFNGDTFPLYMGGGKVAAPDATKPSVQGYQLGDGPQFDERALGLEFSDGTDVTYRFVIPRGQVTATDDIKLARKAAALLGVTFTALSNGPSAPLASFVMTDPAYTAS